MKETKFTKGEWKVTSEDAIKIKAEDGSNIAIITHLTNFKRRDIREAEANAKLIAAAPDLLKSLVMLCESIDSCVELTPEVLQQAQTAIKKAIS